MHKRGAQVRHQIAIRRGVQGETPPGVVIRGQELPRHGVPPLGLDVGIAPQPQPVSEEQLRAVIWMRRAGKDGEVVMPEISVVGISFHETLVA